MFSPTPALPDVDLDLDDIGQSLFSRSSLNVPLSQIVKGQYNENSFTRPLQRPGSHFLQQRSFSRPDQAVTFYPKNIKVQPLSSHKSTFDDSPSVKDNNTFLSKNIFKPASQLRSVPCRASATDARGSFFTTSSFNTPLSQIVRSQKISDGRLNGLCKSDPLWSQSVVPTAPKFGFSRTPKSAETTQVVTSSPSSKPSQAKRRCLEQIGPPDARGVQLRSVEEIRTYQGIFSFPYFNVLQSLVFDEVLYTDNSIVASAPTGSGKTVIFELGLIRLLAKTDNISECGKIVYMAPMKALCTERFQDWNRKLGYHGLSCLEVTGDTELNDFGELLNANLICTTPEKWDSMSRRWRDNKALFQQIQLFLIDEIHTLNDRNRGATVEAVVSRMKTLETTRLSGEQNQIRFIAVSATMPNYNDVAEWLGTPSKPASAFNLGEKYRPVKLDRVVLGYPFKEGTSDFRFDMNLSYRLRSIIETHSHGKPTLVFCSSRKSVVQSAEALAKDMRTQRHMASLSSNILQRAANTIHEHKLSEFLHLGIGIHHAGLDVQDRAVVEDLFKSWQLPVLISTSTLAMGVNLPAHLVIVKSTHFYNMGVVQEYSDMQILQMIGRAGRPQFDTSATAVIMTKSSLKSKYESLINGTQIIESSLHKNLIGHLNAEIVLKTISDMVLVVEWIRHTFLYVRVMKNPKYYGLPSNLGKDEVEKQLGELCLRNLNQLTSLNLVSLHEETMAILPTESGKLMARYCIAFETMKHFHDIDGTQENIADMLNVVSLCAEFEDIQLRTNEKKFLNSLNRDRNKETIRFPMPGKIKTKQMKVNCLIQAQLSCLPVQDFSLSQDMAKIFRVGQRVTKCLMEFMFQRTNYSVLLHAILIYKAFKSKLWFDSRYVARQLDGIGPTMSLALANSGLSSFQKLEQANPRDIELIVNRHPPFGNQVKEAVAALPKYELAVEQTKCYKPNKAVLIMSVDLLNRSALENKPSSCNSHQSILIVGDAESSVIFKWRVIDATILRDGTLTRTFEVKRSAKGIKLNISLLSQDWVGLDVQTDYEPVYSEGWFEPVKTPSLKAQTPASKLRAAIDSAGSKNMEVGKGCNHKCGDKSRCGHKCCKPASVKHTITNLWEAKDAKMPKTEHPQYRQSKEMKEISDIMGESYFSNNQNRISFQTPKLQPLGCFENGEEKNVSQPGVGLPYNSHNDLTRINVDPGYSDNLYEYHFKTKPDAWDNYSDNDGDDNSDVVILNDTWDENQLSKRNGKVTNTNLWKADLFAHCKRNNDNESDSVSRTGEVAHSNKSPMWPTLRSCHHQIPGSFRDLVKYKERESENPNRTSSDEELLQLMDDTVDADTKMNNEKAMTLEGPQSVCDHSVKQPYRKQFSAFEGNPHITHPDMISKKDTSYSMTSRNLPRWSSSNQSDEWKQNSARHETQPELRPKTKICFEADDFKNMSDSAFGIQGSNFIPSDNASPKFILIDDSDTTTSPSLIDQYSQTYATSPRAHLPCNLFHPVQSVVKDITPFSLKISDKGIGGRDEAISPSLYDKYSQTSVSQSQSKYSNNLSQPLSPITKTPLSLISSGKVSSGREEESHSGSSHRYGTVVAWKKDNVALDEDSGCKIKSKCALSDMFVPKAKVSTDVPCTSNSLFEGIF